MTGSPALPGLRMDLNWLPATRRAKCKYLTWFKGIFFGPLNKKLEGVLHQVWNRGNKKGMRETKTVHYRVQKSGRDLAIFPPRQRFNIWIKFRRACRGWWRLPCALLSVSRRLLCRFALFFILRQLLRNLIVMQPMRIPFYYIVIIISHSSS